MKAASGQLLPLAFSISLVTVFFTARPAYAKPKPSMRVTLAAHNLDGYGTVGVYGVYVVLPDGSHAAATCSTTGPTDCGLEPFAPERRKSFDCYDIASHIQATCETDEVYGADRFNQ